MTYREILDTIEDLEKRAESKGLSFSTYFTLDKAKLNTDLVLYAEDIYTLGDAEYLMLGWRHGGIRCMVDRKAFDALDEEAKAYIEKECEEWKREDLR